MNRSTILFSSEEYPPNVTGVNRTVISLSIIARAASETALQQIPGVSSQQPKQPIQRPKLSFRSVKVCTSVALSSITPVSTSSAGAKSVSADPVPFKMTTFLSAIQEVPNPPGYLPPGTTAPTAMNEKTSTSCKK